MQVSSLFISKCAWYSTYHLRYNFDPYHDESFVGYLSILEPNLRTILYFFKKWAIPGLFFIIFVFSIQLTVNKYSINFANGWIRTADLWYRKQLLYQLSHNHCPTILYLLHISIKCVLPKVELSEKIFPSKLGTKTAKLFRHNWTQYFKQILT